MSWSYAIKEYTWLMLLIGYMLASVLWSDIPFISFKRWIRELVAVVMAFVVITESNPRQAMQSLFTRTIYILIPFSLLLIKYFPEYGRQYGHLGWHFNVGRRHFAKEQSWPFVFIATFFLMWTLIRRWQGRDIPVVRYQNCADVFVLILIILAPERSTRH